MDRPREDSRSLSRLFIRHMLDALGIHIAAPTMEPVAPATPTGPFTARKIRYTIGRGYRRITRETTCDRLSIELSVALAQPNTTLIGLDGINGFTCGPTEEELRMFAHPLDKVWPLKVG